MRSLRWKGRFSVELKPDDRGRRTGSVHELGLVATAGEIDSAPARHERIACSAAQSRQSRASARLEISAGDAFVPWHPRY